MVALANPDSLPTPPVSERMALACVVPIAREHLCLKHTYQVGILQASLPKTTAKSIRAAMPHA